MVRLGNVYRNYFFDFSFPNMAGGQPAEGRGGDGAPPGSCLHTRPSPRIWVTERRSRYRAPSRKSGEDPLSEDCTAGHGREATAGNLNLASAQ